MKRSAMILLASALASCAGRVDNKPADMPGSPAEAEQMHQDNTPDKAPPDPETPEPETADEDADAEPPE